VSGWTAAWSRVTGSAASISAAGLSTTGTVSRGLLKLPPATTALGGSAGVMSASAGGSHPPAILAHASRTHTATALGGRRDCFFRSLQGQVEGRFQLGRTGFRREIPPDRDFHVAGRATTH
jgi:hypothetical protein